MTSSQTFASQLKIGEKEVGHGKPAYITAEIGINHNGDMHLAKEMIKAAKDSGCDAVKFQNYKTEDFIRDKSLTYSYMQNGVKIEETQYEMFKRCELSTNDVIDLLNYCRSVDVDFHSTPTGLETLEILVEKGVGVLKNGSDFLSNTPFIQELAKTGLPTVLSTGMARLSDIDKAVSAFKGLGNQQLILLHCVSRYPAPFETLNLRRITALSETFDCLSGFSDHTSGSLAAALSVSYGAIWIEKHFTTDQTLPGPDQHFSCSPCEMAELVLNVRNAEKAIGKGSVWEQTPEELENSKNYRLSCCASYDLSVGHILTKEDITFSRPSCGFSPDQVDLILGNRLSKNIKNGEIFQISHFTK